MDIAKKILIFIGLSILNLGLIALGYYFYINLVKPTTDYVASPDYFQEIIAVVLLMIGLPLLTLKPFKLFRSISIGFMALFIPAFIYAVYFINNIGSTGSYHRLYPIESKTKMQNDIILEVYIYEKSNTVTYAINDEPCNKLDSIQIKIKEGLLGMQIITHDISLTKKPDCGG